MKEEENIILFQKKKEKIIKLKVLSPSGIFFQNPLPIAKDEEVTLSSLSYIYKKIFQEIKFLLSLTSNYKYKIRFYKKKMELSFQEIKIKKKGETKEIYFDLSKKKISHRVICVTYF